jgi:hypothetical protein
MCRLVRINFLKCVISKETNSGGYSPLLCKLRITAAAMPNPSKAIKRMTANPPTTPPIMAAI